MDTNEKKTHFIGKKQMSFLRFSTAFKLILFLLSAIFILTIMAYILPSPNGNTGQEFIVIAIDIIAPILTFILGYMFAVRNEKDDD